ncbi:MAG: hypothetical protein R2712_19665 [Vicinamibacterales bacterium]
MTPPPAGGPRLLVVALGYTALALVFTWPLAAGLATDVPGDMGDSLLNMWILEWGAQHLPALAAGRLSWEAFWSANIFYPEPCTLALSEHMVPQALQVAPVLALTGNIILGYNLLFLSTFVLSALGAYLLVRDLTGDWRAALVAGLVYGFLPYRIAQIPHVQVLSSQWMPFALFGFNRYVERRSACALAGRDCRPRAAEPLLRVHYLLFFAPLVPLFVVHRLWAHGRLADLRAWAGFAAAGVVTVLLTVPFLLPYLTARTLFGLDRGEGEVLGFSANVWGYATAADAVRLWGGVLNAFPRSENETFLGVAATVLAVAGVVAGLAGARARVTIPPISGWRRWVAAGAGSIFLVQLLAAAGTVIFGRVRLGFGIRATDPLRVALQALAALVILLAMSPRAREIARRFAQSPAAIGTALLLLAAWLSLGPEPAAGLRPLEGIGLYRVLYEHVPGFSGLRVPARYAMVAGLFLSVVAGTGAAALARRSWGQPLLAALAVLIVADAAAMPLPMNHTWSTVEARPPARIYPATRMPRIYQAVRDLPPGSAIAEFPFGDDGWEIRAVYYAAAHDKPIVNGYSGAFPPRYLSLKAALRRVGEDGDRAWDALRGSGATHAVVHVPAFANPDDARLTIGWLESHGARYVVSFPDGDALFELPARDPLASR